MKTYSSWKTEKFIVKIIDRDFGDQEKERWTKDKQKLKQYSLGENPFKNPAEPTKSASPPLSIYITSALGYSGRAHALAMRSLFSSNFGNWLPHYRDFSAANFWRITLKHHAPRSEIFFTHTMAAISDCLYLGWLDRAELLIKEAHLAYNGKRFFGVKNIYSQPLYHFLLRICFDWLQLKFDGWGIDYYDAATDPHIPIECMGESVLNELFVYWKAPDLSGMQDKLQWLCDFYTHCTASRDGTEFGYDLLHTRFPALILSWFRLRESLGLNNPIIDHPLMRPHYVYLPPPQPFYTDDLLDGVIARLRREEIPGLGIVPAQVVPKDAPEIPKRNLLARLLGK